MSFFNRLVNCMVPGRRERREGASPYGRSSNNRGSRSSNGGHAAAHGAHGPPQHSQQHWQQHAAAVAAAQARASQGHSQAAPANATSQRDAIRSAVWKLPLETFASPEEMGRWSVSDLRRELQEANARTPQNLAGSSQRQTPIEKSELVEAVREARGGEAGATCAVCCDDFESEDTVRVLRCGHRFHLECVDKWLLVGHEVTAECPMCKASILP